MRRPEVRAKFVGDRHPLKNPKHLNSFREAMRRPEHRAAQSERSKRRWTDPDYRSRNALGQRKARIQRGCKGTDIERMMLDCLVGRNIQAVPQYPVDAFLLDFALLEQKVVIECDEEYWHDLPGIREKDARKDSVLVGLGWTVLRFSGTCIRKNVAVCVDEVEKILSGG